MVKIAVKHCPEHILLSATKAVYAHRLVQRHRKHSGSIVLQLNRTETAEQKCAIDNDDEKKLM